VRRELVVIPNAPSNCANAPTLASTTPPRPKGKFASRSLLNSFGPGLITGASDDDPSGIATYSQVGAQFGYGMLWTMLFSYPLMAVIQEISARIGRVTGVGIAGNIRRHYPRPILYVIVLLVLSANIFNLGADVGAMGAALQLLVPGRLAAYILLFGGFSLALQVYVPYTKYVPYLKWLTLALFAYVATAFIAHVSWLQVIHGTLLPSLSLRTGFFTGLVAVLGTTISPYLFFWQASQEAEEVATNPADQPLKKSPRQAPIQLSRIRLDTYVGMALSNLIALFIIVTTAATLHAHGVLNVETSAQAAKALEPLAGRFAFVVFGLGIIGTGLLAVPVLAGSAAYAVGEALKWRPSLEKKPEQAPKFYWTLTAATGIGLTFNFIGLDPIRALFWAAVLNGVVAAPIMAVLMLMASDRRVMGKFTVSPSLKLIGWFATGAMLFVAVGVFATLK
jgi:NRAMP (natural resistance-associated macrophage protein)-like metal ion transporter